jgi:hypothetical protein
MSPAQAVVAAMITPALLILASGSLVATALVRLARVVDRSRVLIATIDAGSVANPEALRHSLDRHEQRALYAERSVGLFFFAVCVFVIDCLSIGIDHFAGDRLVWLPIALTIGGMVVLIAGSAYMVAESRLGAQQIVEEISQGRERLSGEAAAQSGAGSPRH